MTDPNPSLPVESFPDVAGGPDRRSEAGSAYLVAILALVVLTIIGLSLALITQTEMQIGANEKLIERSFYAADSGISLSTARTLVTRRPAWSELYKILDPEGDRVHLEHLVDVSPFYPISRGPCNLCDIADAGQYASRNYERVTHAVTSTAVRRVPGTEIPLAERSLTAMVELQPWETKPESVRAILDEAELDKIHF